LHAVQAKLADENTHINDQIATIMSNAAATKDIRRKAPGLVFIVTPQ
jgi:hypothetical protein